MLASACRRNDRRGLWFAVAVIVGVVALGLLALAAVEDADSVQTDTVPDAPAPSTVPATTSPSSTTLDTAPPSAPNTTTAPTTTLLASIETPPMTTPAVTTTTVLLPLRFYPDTSNPDLYPIFADLPPPSDKEVALIDAVEQITGWHGQGHEIIATWGAHGIVDAEELGQGVEAVLSCALWQMVKSHQILERAAEARSTLILGGTPEAEITAQPIVAQMTIDDPSTFEIDPVEHKYLLLICGGISDEQARVIASM